MTLLALAIFSFCTWAVLSRHFCDGIIAKNFLSLSAIISFLGIVDPCNHKASWVAGALLVAGILYAYFRPTRSRPLIHVGRAKHRPF